MPVATIKQNGLGVLTELAALAGEALGEVRDELIGNVLTLIADNPKTVMTIKGLKNSITVIVTKQFGAVGLALDVGLRPPDFVAIKIPPNLDFNNVAQVQRWIDEGFQTNPDGTAILWSPRMGPDP